MLHFGKFGKSSFELLWLVHIGVTAFIDKAYSCPKKKTFVYIIFCVNLKSFVETNRK